VIKKINFSILSCLLVFVTLASIVTIRTAAEPEKTIYVDDSVRSISTIVAVINPLTGDSNFRFADPALGTKFLANITITNVTRLAGWQLNITYDPTLLNISRSADMLLPSNHIFNGLDPKASAKTINNTAGYAMWACAIGPSSPTDHFNGSGTICQIFFTIKKTPGEGETFSCNLVLDKVGMFPTKLVDPDTGVIPFTEQNGYYEIRSGLIHDVALIDVKPFKTVVGQRYVSINITAQNQGDYAEIFNITAYCNSTPILTIININLTSGTNIRITLIWNTTGFTKGNYILSANATLVDGETDTVDNVYIDGSVTLTILGDINGDFKVDIQDLVLVIKHFGSYPTHPKWNPNADVSGDDKVDIEDLVSVVKHFGEHYP